MFLYSGNLPLLYSGNPKSKGGLLKSTKEESYKSFDLQDSLAEREGDNSKSPPSVTR